jgi:hypothetical protein
MAPFPRRLALGLIHKKGKDLRIPLAGMRMWKESRIIELAALLVIKQRLSLVYLILIRRLLLESISVMSLLIPMKNANVGSCVVNAPTIDDNILPIESRFETFD